jgi:hypothetical protein
MSKMWKNWLGAIISLFVALLPFLGFPRSLKDILYMLSGLILIAIFFMLASDRTKDGHGNA